MNFCKNCGGQIKETDKFCGTCGQVIDRNITYTTPTNQKENTQTPVQPSEPNATVNRTYLYTSPEDIARTKIRKELNSIKINPNSSSFIFLNRKRIIFTIIISIINAIIISLAILSRQFLPLFAILFGINLLIYLVNYKKFTNESYILKQVQKRPTEKIHDIINDLHNNGMSNVNNSYINIIILVGSIVLTMIPFIKPFYIYEENGDGYNIKYYNPGLIPESKINIPSSHKGKSVVGIRGYAFANCKNVKEIIVPNTVKQINGHAFENDTSLVSIVLPDDLEVINGYTFNNDRQLTNINIPSKLKEIGGYAFANCRSITNIKLPNTLIEIRGHAFDGDMELVSINLPESLESIGGGAFTNCSSLKSITIPPKVTIIQGNTFSNCSSLEEVNLHDDITEIHGEVFLNCRALKNIKLPSKITEIRGNTFEFCTSLREIDIPNGVTRIGGHAFFGCSSLSRIYVPDTVVEIGSSAFRQCYALKTIELPTNTIVNERAFKESPTQITRRKTTGGYNGYSN